MGIKLMERAWQVSDVYHTEKYVLIALAYYGEDKTEQAWISASELASLTGVSKRQIMRVLKSLQELPTPLISSATNVFSKSLWRLHLPGGVQP